MKKIALAIICIAFLFTQTLTAQFGLKLAPVTGLNFNIGTGADLEKTATGFGMVTGAQVDMNFTPVIGIITAIQFYDNRSGSFSEQGTFEGVPFTIKQKASIAYFVVEPLLKIAIPNSGFYFVAGPALGINIQGSQELRLTSSGNLTFQDGSTRIKQSMQNTNARFEFKAGAGFDIPVASWIDLTPQLTFGLGITKIMQDVESRIMTVQLSTAVKFKLI